MQTRETKQRALDRLKAEGLRLTAAREQLISFIIESEGHWTIQNMNERLSKAFPDIGVATVYRTVSLLHRLGFLDETRIGNEAARYEVTSLEHHDHLTCNQCSEIFEFENEKIEELQAAVAKKLGFQLTDHRMELYADCKRPHCKNLKTPKSVK